jgi:hypothetical protein
LFSPFLAPDQDQHQHPEPEHSEHPILQALQALQALHSFLAQLLWFLYQWAMVLLMTPAS